MRQRCLREAWKNYKNNPGSQMMVGPGLGEDTRHFWVVTSDDVVIDAVPGYEKYSHYREGVFFDPDKNRVFLDSL